MRLTPCSSSEIDEAGVQAMPAVALDEIEAEARQLARRRVALDGQLGDVGRVQAAGELVLDDGAGADTGLVDDQLARGDPGRVGRAIRAAASAR